MTKFTRALWHRELRCKSNYTIVFFCAMSILLIIAQMLKHYFF